MLQCGCLRDFCMTSFYSPKSMEWNMEETFSMEWNERFLVRNENGMAENCQYGIWKHRLPFHTMPCYSFIHRHLLFGVALRGSINPTYLTKLQRVQNKAIHIITNNELRASINPCLFKSVILKVLELYKFEIAKLMHQRHKPNLPVASQNFFKPLFSVHEHLIRSKSKNKLYSPKLFILRCQNLSNIMVPNFGILSHLKLESNRSVNLKHE